MNIPTSLSGLNRELKGILLPELQSRPFIADGSPFNCDVAIIGINPGTSTSFWDFWSDDFGFARESWIKAYYSDPHARRNATRNRIERLIPALRPLRVIELNAYPYATRTEAEITAEMKDTRVLHLMLRVSRPKALFLFGREPARIVASLLNLNVPAPGSLIQGTYEGRDLQVFVEPHLSRGWSYAAVEAMGMKVKHVLHPAVSHSTVGWANGLSAQHSKR